MLHAALVLAHPDAIGKGVMIVYGGEIHAARFAYNAFTEGLTRFESPNNGPIGYITAGHPHFTADPVRGQ